MCVEAGGLTRSTSASLTPKICSSAPGWTWLAACQGLRGTNACFRKGSFTMRIYMTDSCSRNAKDLPPAPFQLTQQQPKPYLAFREWNRAVGHLNLPITSHLNYSHFNWNGQAKGSIVLHTYRENSGNLFATERSSLKTCYRQFVHHQESSRSTELHHCWPRDCACMAVLAARPDGWAIPRIHGFGMIPRGWVNF